MIAAPTVSTAASVPAIHLARPLRDALGAYPTGVTVVTTRAADGRPVGLTVNSFASLSLEPPLLLWSLANRSPNLRAFRTASHFAINVLAHDQAGIAQRFATPTVVDKFDGIALRGALQAGADLAPLLEGTVAHFVCASRDAIETGDHTLFIGRIEHHWQSEGDPLVFHGGRFASVAPRRAQKEH
jgi:flavin reductase (DIM6/NTAB) family NADH-FMN oxidoreductase RutF